MPTTRHLDHQLLDVDGRATFLTHFLASHRAFRRDAARFPIALHRIGTGQAPDTDALRRHWAGYNAALAYHHHMEDEQLFPALRQLDGALGDVITTLLAQHHDLNANIIEVEELLRLLPSGEAAGPAALACEDLAAALGAHLDLEEERLVPVLRTTGFEPDHGEPAETHEDRQQPQDDPLAFVLPWTTDGLGPETVAALLRSGPPTIEASFADWQTDYTDRLARWWP
jgi:Hemerythrin HHE cation binding domain